MPLEIVTERTATHTPPVNPLVAACRGWLAFIDSLPGGTELSLSASMKLVQLRHDTIDAIAAAEGQAS